MKDFEATYSPFFILEGLSTIFCIGTIVFTIIGSVSDNRFFAQLLFFSNLKTFHAGKFIFHENNLNFVVWLNDVAPCFYSMLLWQ